MISPKGIGVRTHPEFVSMLSLKVNSDFESLGLDVNVAVDQLRVNVKKATDDMNSCSAKSPLQRMIASKA